MNELKSVFPVEQNELKRKAEDVIKLIEQARGYLRSSDHKDEADQAIEFLKSLKDVEGREPESVSRDGAEYLLAIRVADPPRLDRPLYVVAFRDED